jgi:hypothetical protein
MTGLVRVSLVLLAAVFMLLGLAGRLPHEWLGISTATLIGWGIAYLDRIIGLVLLIVILDRQRQLKRDMARLAYWVGAGPRPERGKVVQLRREQG